MVQIWVGECNESRLFKDACYLLQILVDCSLNHGSDQSSIYATKYGQALESVQRYEDAVNIYAEIAEENFVPKHSKCATESSEDSQVLHSLKRRVTLELKRNISLLFELITRSFLAIYVTKLSLYIHLKIT